MIISYCGACGGSCPLHIAVFLFLPAEVSLSRTESPIIANKHEPIWYQLSVLVSLSWQSELSTGREYFSFCLRTWFFFCIFHFRLGHKKFYRSWLRETHSKRCNWQIKRKTFWSFCPTDERNSNLSHRQRTTEDAMLTPTVVTRRSPLISSSNPDLWLWALLYDLVLLM